MSKTIRKLANELHITKQAIYQRMDAIEGFRMKYTTFIGNRIMVNANGEQLLKNFEKIDKYDKEYQQEDHQFQQEGYLLVLKHQLDIKDYQISKLLSELEKQQELYQDALNEITVLTEKINRSDDNQERHKYWKLWR